MKILFSKHHPIFHKKFLLFKKFLSSDFSECFLLVAFASTFNCRASFERFVPCFRKVMLGKKIPLLYQPKASFKMTSAARLSCPASLGFRPVALRPRLSTGLPFRSSCFVLVVLHHPCQKTCNNIPNGFSF